jgi:hypothetical protein
LPPRDTPGVATANPRNPASLSRTAAEAAWHAVTPSIAGSPHVRVSRDGGRTCPARHARPLPADPPGQPCTVPVYDPGAGTGRVPALDLDPGRGRGTGDPQLRSAPGRRRSRAWSRGSAAGVLPTFPRAAAAMSTSCLPRRCPGASCATWPGLFPCGSRPSTRRRCRPWAARSARPGPAQVRRWRVLSTSLEDARAAAGHPNGPEVWDALLAELAAELRHVEPLEPPGGVPDGAEGARGSGDPARRRGGYEREM